MYYMLLAVHDKGKVNNKLCVLTIICRSIQLKLQLQVSVTYKAKQKIKSADVAIHFVMKL